MKESDTCHCINRERLLCSFLAPMTPKAKQSFRASRFGGFQPKAIVTAEYEIGMVAKMAMRGALPSPNPIHLECEFRFIVPASASKRRRESMLTAEWPVKPPDLDNLVKLAGDALKGIVYVDDKQIVDMHLRKRWSTADGVFIKVWEM